MLPMFTRGDSKQSLTEQKNSVATINDRKKYAVLHSVYVLRHHRVLIVCFILPLF